MIEPPQHLTVKVIKSDTKVNHLVTFIEDQSKLLIDFVVKTLLCSYNLKYRKMVDKSLRIVSPGTSNICFCGPRGVLDNF